MKFVVYFPVSQLEKWKDIPMKELRLLFIFLLPVLMTEFITRIFWVLVIWIPSVLGLSPGAVIMRSEARTFSHLSKERCICWLSLILRFFTIKFLQDLKVKACWNEKRSKSFSKFSFFVRQNFKHSHRKRNLNWERKWVYVKLFSTA